MNFYLKYVFLFLFCNIYLTYSEIRLEGVLPYQYSFKDTYAQYLDQCQYDVDLFISGVNPSGINLNLSPPAVLSFNTVKQFNTSHIILQLNTRVPLGNQSLTLSISDGDGGNAEFKDFTWYLCESIPILDIEFTTKTPGFSPIELSNRENVIFETIIMSIQNLKKRLPYNTFDVTTNSSSITGWVIDSYYEQTFNLVLQMPQFRPDCIGPLQIKIFEKVNQRNYFYTLGSYISPRTPDSNQVQNVEFYPMYSDQYKFICGRLYNFDIFAQIMGPQSPYSTIFYSTLDGQTFLEGYGTYSTPLLGNPSTNVTYRYRTGFKNFDEGSPSNVVLQKFDGSSKSIISQNSLSINSTDDTTVTNVDYNSVGTFLDSPSPFYLNYLNAGFSLRVTIEETKFVFGAKFPNQGEYLQMPFPFGLSKGHLKEFELSYSAALSNNSVSNYEIQFFVGDTMKYNYNPQILLPPPTLTDVAPPKITDIKFSFVNYTHYLLRVFATDDLSGVSTIDISNVNKMSSSNLVYGTPLDGIFETFVKFEEIYFADTDSQIVDLVNFHIRDFAGNTKVYSEREFLYGKFVKTPIDPLTLFYNSNPISISNFTYFRFSENNIDLSNSGKSQLNLRYNLTNSNWDFEPILEISYPTKDSEKFKGSWNFELKLYEIKFSLPPRVFTGSVEYFLTVSTHSFHSKDIVSFIGNDANLKVTSEYGDQSPPVIKDISLIQPGGDEVTISGGDISIGWFVKIQDYPNGFNDGVIHVTSNLDAEPRVFILNSTNRDRGTPFEGDYKIQIVQTYPCTSQIFSISYAELRDSTGNTAQRDDFSTERSQFIDPFYLVKNKTYPISLVCLTPAQLPLDIPELKTLDLYIPSGPPKIDTGYYNSSFRTAHFVFSVDSGEQNSISDRHYPWVYLTIPGLPIISSQSKMINATSDWRVVYYETFMTIPFGTHPSLPVLISIYGISDIFSTFRGYSSLDLQTKGLISTVPIQRTNRPYIESASRITFEGGILTLYGYFGYGENSNACMVDYLDGNGFNGNILTIVSEPSGRMMVVKTIKPVTKPFVVRVYSGGGQADYTVTPVAYPPPPPTPTPSPTDPTQSPSSSPFPTPSPGPKCPGSPPCGGSNQGKCDENLGCQCISPWYGFNCGSQVINTTKPDPDTGKPDSKTDGKLPNGNDINFTSLISMVSLRELNFVNREPIKTFNFSVWNFDNLSDQASGKTLYQSQSMIGINLRNYKESVILDPDFSVIVDYQDSNNPLSICSKKSGLSKTQIAGIVVGAGVAFIAIVTASTIYYFKSSKEQKAMKNIQNKLKNINKD
eukprot:gene2587-3204_t